MLLNCRDFLCILVLIIKLLRFFQEKKPDKHLAILPKEKRKHSNEVRSERGDTATDITVTKWIIRDKCKQQYANRLDNRRNGQILRTMPHKHRKFYIIKKENI